MIFDLQGTIRFYSDILTFDTLQNRDKLSAQNTPPQNTREVLATPTGTLSGIPLRDLLLSPPLVIIFLPKREAHKKCS